MENIITKNTYHIKIQITNKNKQYFTLPINFFLGLNSGPNIYIVKYSNVNPTVNINPTVKNKYDKVSSIRNRLSTSTY